MHLSSLSIVANRARWKSHYPELAEHFGKPLLKLGFHQVTPGSELELVAHGSRLFDRMLLLLDRRGALTMQMLPNRHPSSQELMTAYARSMPALPD